MRDSAKTSSRKSTKPTRTASTATAKTTATRNFTKNNTAKDFYAVTKTLSIANPGKGRPKKQTLNRPAWRIPLHDTPIVDSSCRIRPQVVVCFAKILCALKMPRFPAAMAVPSRFVLEMAHVLFMDIVAYASLATSYCPFGQLTTNGRLSSLLYPPIDTWLILAAYGGAPVKVIRRNEQPHDQ